GTPRVFLSPFRRRYAMPATPLLRRLTAAALLAGALALTPARAGEKAAPPAAPRPSGPYTHGNLTVFLLHGPDQIKGKNFLTLDAPRRGGRGAVRLLERRPGQPAAEDRRPGRGVTAGGVERSSGPPGSPGGACPVLGARRAVADQLAADAGKQGPERGHRRGG